MEKPAEGSPDTKGTSRTGLSKPKPQTVVAKANEHTPSHGERHGARHVRPMRQLTNASRSHIHETNIFVFNNFINVGLPGGAMPLVSQGMEMHSRHATRKSQNAGYG